MNLLQRRISLPATLLLLACSEDATSSGGPGGSGTTAQILASEDSAALPLVPTRLPLSLLSEAGGNFEIIAGAAYAPRVLNTDDGTIGTVAIVNNVATVVDPVALPPGVKFNVISQGNGVAELAVISADTIRLDREATVYVEGSRALVFAVKQDITIDGVLDCRGTRRERFASGAGGFDGASGINGNTGGKGPGGGSWVANCGGGGGGHRDAGSNGGGCANAGSPSSNPELTPFIGGSGGAAGKAANNAYSQGGGGGGATMMAALGTVTVSPAGVINCSGKGGAASTLWGAGGGAGGAILIEAGKLVVQGSIVANGGGGAGGGMGGMQNQILSTNGYHGEASKLPANGGKDPQGLEVGGKGGATDGKPTDGTNQGGGAGSSGRIRLCSMNTPQVRGIISPTPAILVGDCAGTPEMPAPSM